jgi:hypothetical protein
VRRSPVVTLSLAIAFVLSGCGWAGTHDRVSKPNGFQLHGYVAVPSSCGSGVPDIHAGAEVKIAEDTGKTIATGTLGDGVAEGGTRCNYPFEISNVPGSYDRVVVLVGLQPAATFSTSELREGGTAVISVPSVTASSSPS